MTTEVLAARGSLRRMLPPGSALPGASPLVVVLVILAAASAFATWQAHTEPVQASHGTAAWAMAGSGHPSVTSMPATPDNSGSDSSPLSNNASGEEDGASDALDALAIFAFWVLLLRDGGILLASWDGPAKLSSLYVLALQRPG